MSIKSSFLFSSVVFLGIGLVVLRTEILCGTEKTDSKTRVVKIKELSLTVPSHWKQNPPSNRLRLAEFEVPAEKDHPASELSIYSFPGGGGGHEANIKRWISQFDAQGRNVDLKSGTTKTSFSYLIVEISGTYQKPIGPPIRRKTKPVPNSRLLAVIIDLKDQGNYFLKLIGNDQAVTQAKQALKDSFGANSQQEKKYSLGKN